MKKNIFWGAVAVLCLIAAVFYWTESSRDTPVPSPAITESRSETQGNITFYSGEKNKTIEVEIARSIYEHSKGLMDRTSLPHNQGMLFIFEEMGPRSFWMRNTRISLDIIYVDDQKKVVSIQKNAVPMSDESLPSTGPAQYVIEVNAGFSDLYGIQPGDSLSFQIP